MTVDATATAPTYDLPSFEGYQVIDLIGRGGMGRVYRAKHLALGRTVAIKVMTHEGDDRLLARFREEARAVAKLQHPNIAQLFETGTSTGRPFYSLEYADGGTLAQRWGGKPQDPLAAANTLECVARAIQHSHEHGILHRDLKPGNVLLTADGTPKVADFGLAKELSAASIHSTTSGEPALTQTGEILGTPAYMPPEQASGIMAKLTPAADVYSLGAMLYEALTGRPPFQAPDALQTLFLVLSAEAVPPRTLLPKLPRDLDTICLKCLEKQARKRYATAKELADDLHRWQVGEPILARPIGAVERATKWARRHKAGAALVAVSAILLLALVGFTIAQVVISTQLKTANEKLAANNIELEKAKNEADQSYGLATSTLDEIVRDTTLKLNGMPNGEALLLDLLARQSNLNRQLRALRPEDSGASSRYRIALTMQSAYENNYGRFDAATRTRQALKDYLETELARMPDDADLRAIEARMAYDAASAANGRGELALAAKGRTEFLRLAERFVKQFPNHRDSPRLEVYRHWFRGFDAAAKEDGNARIASLRDAVAASRTMTDPNDRFTFLSASLGQLAIVLKINNQLEEADKVFTETETVYRKGAPGVDSKTAEFCRSGIAQAKANRAQIARNMDRLDDAKQLYAEAEPLLRSLEKDFPLTLLYKQNLANCVFWQGAYGYAENTNLGRKQMDEAIAILDDELKRRSDKSLQDIRYNLNEVRKAVLNPPK
jgi:serine/threonine protein kinase